MDFCGGEALNDAHGLSAKWAVPGSAVRQRRKRQRFASLIGKQCARQGQQLFAEAVGQQAIAADAHEAFRQYMQEEVECYFGGAGYPSAASKGM